MDSEMIGGSRNCGELFNWELFNLKKTRVRKKLKTVFT